MAKKQATYRKPRAKQNRGNSNPFDWTVKLIPNDDPQCIGEAIQLQYGIWNKTLVPIGTTGLLAHAETHEQRPRVLIAGVDSTSAFGQPLPVPVKVWKWGTAVDDFRVEKAGFYLYSNDSIEIRGKSFWLECTKN